MHRAEALAAEWDETVADLERSRLVSKPACAAAPDDGCPAARSYVERLHGMGGSRAAYRAWPAQSPTVSQR